MGRQLLRCFSIHRVVDPARVLGIALALNQAGLAQDAHVMRDQVQRQAQPPRDLAVTLHALHQQVEDPQAPVMGERLERQGQLLDRLYLAILGVRQSRSVG